MTPTRKPNVRLFFSGRITLTLAALAAGCSSTSTAPSPTSDASTPDASLACMRVVAPAPVVHRTTTSCPATAYPNEGVNDAGSKACTTNADCGDAGITQTCRGGTCQFDECLSDGDCASGSACACASELFNEVTHPNRCIPAGCRSDADCPSNAACSPAKDPSCPSITGYFCRSVADTCAPEADCCGSDTVSARCAYEPTARHWTCQLAGGCSG